MMIIDQQARNPRPAPMQLTGKIETSEARAERIGTMLSDDKAKWYAFTVPPQKELLAEHILCGQGHKAIVPLEYQYRRVNAHQKIKRSAPYVVASRYVFVEVATAQRWNELLKLNVLSGVVRCGDSPALVPVDILRRLSVPNGADGRSGVRLNRGIKAGDSVRLNQGPFTGFEATIDEVERELTNLTVHIFGRPCLVKVPIYWCDAA